MTVVLIKSQQSVMGVRSKSWILRHTAASAVISFSTKDVRSFLDKLGIRCIPNMLVQLILLVVVLAMRVANVSVANFFDYLFMIMSDNKCGSYINEKYI